MKRRLRTCVENWPECRSGEYNPKCCRFPKSCSCTVYNPDTIAEVDLETSALYPTECILTNHTVDWASMTPRAQLESLKNAPKRIFGPWVEKNNDGPYWIRDSLGGSRAEWFPDGRLYVGRIIGIEQAFPTRASADAWLRNQGWILVED